MRHRRFQLIAKLFLLVALFGISFIPKLAFSDDVASDTAVAAEDNQVAENEADGEQIDDPGISLDASYDEFVEYANTYHQDMPDPEHMWSGDNEISLLSGSPYWQTVNGKKAFYDAYGAEYAYPALKVIDVSHHQAEIDWDQVKNSDVDAVILRVGYGVGNEDRYIARNIAEVRRLNIPYGVYLYSYAYDTDFAAQEAAWTATLLDKYGTEGMVLPIYYDLEEFSTWDGHRPPTDPNTYEAMVNTYCDVMASRGYSNVHVYSYRAYLQSALNKPSIWAKTSWIAAYTSTIGIDNPYYVGQKGWQYTASGSVPGINGNADISAFTNWDYVNVEELPLVNLDNGTYYINSHLKDSSSVTIPGGSMESGARTELWSYDKSASQRFVFTRQDDGSYVITNEASGLALDVELGVAKDGAVVQQYEPNGTAAQHWFIRDAGDGYYIQSELGNWVLDVAGASQADGTPVTLYTPNGSAAQKFIAAAPSTISTDVPLKISSALNQSKVLDINNASHNDRAKAQLFSWNGTDAQLFRLYEVGNGIYEMVNVESGKAVEAEGGLTANGTKISQFTRNGTLSQHWNAVCNDDGSFTFINCNSGKALDVPNANASDFTQLQLFESNASSAQRWVVEGGFSTSRDRINQFALEHKGTIAEGVYAIASASAPMQVVDVDNGSHANSANVQLFATNGSNAQRWSISEDDEGYLTITNLESGKVIDVANGSKDNGTNIQQFEANNSYAQKWIAVKTGDSFVFYSALAENKVMDLWNGGVANGTNVNLFESNGTQAQKYKLFSKQQAPASDFSDEVGTYILVAPDGRVLDVPLATSDDGTQLQVFDSNGSFAQSFIIRYETQNDGYTIQSLASGKMLDASGGDFVPGSAVQQWGTAADNVPQRCWSIKMVDDRGYLVYNHANGLVLGLDQNDKLISVSSEDERAVVWSIEDSPYPATTEELEHIASDGIVISDGIYQIASVGGRSFVVDVDGGSHNSGANVQIYGQNGTDAQRWQVKNLPNGFITLTNVGSGMCLDVVNGAANSGSNVWQFEPNGSLAQMWVPVEQEDGSVILFSALGNGLVLDVQDGIIRNSANIWVYRLNYTAAQKFEFELIG